MPTMVYLEGAKSIGSLREWKIRLEALKSVDVLMG